MRRNARNVSFDEGMESECYNPKDASEGKYMLCVVIWPRYLFIWQQLE
jgi:hypothetical protein